jgi:HEAT repeat protein
MTIPSEPGPSKGLEYFKVFSTFISSVVIALTGIYLTNKYNSQQLEIARQQAHSQLALARLQEISKIVPKLGSADNNERRFGAIALGMYGIDAVPALLVLLNDPSGDVRLAGTDSLALIGHIAAPKLTEVLLNRRNPTDLRSGAIYALGKMQAAEAFSLASEILSNPNEDPIVRKDAVTAMGFLRDERAVPSLLKRLAEARLTDEELAINLVWSLRQIADPRATDALKSIISDGNENLQSAAMWALAECNPAEAQGILGALAADVSKSPKLRGDAGAAVAHARRRATPQQQTQQ